MGGVTNYMHNLKVAREAWSKRPITFTVKSLKKTLTYDSPPQKKNQDYLRATHSDISNIKKRKKKTSV